MNITNERRAQIAQRLAELENPETGRLTPEAVVADAKRKTRHYTTCSSGM